MLTSDQIENAARMLTEARQAGALIESLGEYAPTDVATAEQIADLHAAQLGIDVVGWKVGATSEAAMTIMGCDEPFCGRVFAGTIHEPGVLSDLPPNAKIESEFAFHLGADLGPRPTSWTAADVRAATESVSPAIEIIGTRFSDFAGAGFINIIADSAANGGVVLGPRTPTNDLPDLAALAVTCTVDGVVTGSGVGADVLGDPWESLAWLANHLGDRGVTVAAGQLVMSGTCTGIAALDPGSSAVVDYGDFGRLVVSA